MLTQGRGRRQPAVRRFRRLAAVLAVALPWVMPALAISIDSRSQLHAVIGQPLAVALPVSLAEANPNGVAVKISPGPDLPDEEQAVAESVQGYYDATQGVVRLSTPNRVMVPAIGLHVVVSSGNLVLNYDLDVLVDVPDLQAQHTARPVAPPPPLPAEAQAPAIRVLAIDKPPAEVTPQRRYGQASVAAVDDAQRPSATPPPPPPPPDPRPHSWIVHAGDTLGSISHRLAELYGVGDEPMALALYEANRDAFQQAPPQRAAAGRTLLVPEDYVMRSEPVARVADFGAWLRQPQGSWKLRSFPDLRPAAASPPAPEQRSMLQAMTVVLGMTVAVALAVILLRRLRLRQLLTRYVPMSAVRVKKIRRIIIPTPPPRRGLSQGAVTEKLRIKRLREVLDDNPLRSDIRYRLAERLYKAGDARGFGQVAPPLRPSLSPQGWKRICAMGHELSPDDPRFLT